MNCVVRYLNENHYNHVKYNESLSKYTSFRVGGNAAIVVMPESKNKIISLIHYLNENQIPYKVLGNGSNILPSDDEYKGVIIKTNKALNYLMVNDTTITVGSGYSLVALAYKMADLELTGLEFLGGIPGSVGGAIYMNAGAYNREMKDVVLNVTLIDENGELKTMKSEELEYRYRHSILQKKKPNLIIETTLKLEKGNKDEIKELLKHRRERRLETQPLDYPSGGSTFRNPDHTHAYLLIDQAGLRGYKIGGAKVSEKHCNFIINVDHASSRDIKNLIDYIIKSVYQHSKIHLIPEIELFNWQNH